LSFTLAVTVPTSIANGTRITNTIEITATGSGNNPIDDLSSASSTVYQNRTDQRCGAPETNGQVFAVEGQVIVVPGTYSTREWELQDASGAIVMFYSPAPSVALSDHIRVVAPRNTLQCRNRS